MLCGASNRPWRWQCRSCWHAGFGDLAAQPFGVQRTPLSLPFFSWTTKPPIFERLGAVSVVRKSARLFFWASAPPPRLMMWMAASHRRQSMGTGDPPLW